MKYETEIFYFDSYDNFKKKINNTRNFTTNNLIEV